MIFCRTDQEAVDHARSGHCIARIEQDRPAQTMTIGMAVERPRALRQRLSEVFPRILGKRSPPNA